jgi:4-hydroxy-tetrahydrodipicolinate synthase
VIVYNTPRYANPLNIETAREVLGMTHVVGVKDSSADPAVLRQLVAIAAELPGVAVSQGAETQLVDGLAAGAHGIVPGVGNVAPAVCLDLFASWEAGDREAADAAQRVVTDLTTMHQIHRGVAAVKQLLAIAGLAAPSVTPPLLPCDEVEQAEFRRFAERYENVLLRGAA